MTIKLQEYRLSEGLLARAGRGLKLALKCEGYLQLRDQQVRRIIDINGATLTVSHEVFDIPASKTAWKIASWFLTLGLLPLIATIISRCNRHWTIKTAPSIASQNRAARVIKKAYLARKAQKELVAKGLAALPENKLPLYFAIKKLKEASKEALAAGDFDRQFEACLIRASVTKNVYALRFLAYALNSKVPRNRRYIEKEIHLLYNLFTEEIPDIPLIATTLKKYFKNYKEKALPLQLELEQRVPSSSNHFENRPYTTVLPQITGDRTPHLEALLQNPASEYTDISHGGGLWFIRDFLNGRTKGYTGEFRGEAVFFSPRIFERNTDNGDEFYAQRAAALSFDLPVRVRAMARPNDLIRVQNSNFYEAAIRSENIKKLKNIQVEIVADHQEYWAVRRP